MKLFFNLFSRKFEGFLRYFLNLRKEHSGLCDRRNLEKTTQSPSKFPKDNRNKFKTVSQFR